MLSGNKYPTFKDWILALKSGDYTQQKNVLSGPDGNCCLGVYGRLCGKTNEELRMWNRTTHLEIFDIYGPVASRLKQIPFGLDHTLAKVLAILNDGGYGFEQIADLLIFFCWGQGIEQKEAKT